MSTLKATGNKKSKTMMRTLGFEKLITNAQGDIEFVVIPINAYEKLLELIEDYGLGLAMKAAEGEKLYSKDEALRSLENA
jgi:hypothetical protein